MTGHATRRFTQALDGLVEQVKQDRAILAAILCGSLSYDLVWAKSDIDLVLVTVDDRKRDEGISLNADGVNVHALLVSRTEFRQIVEGATGQSFMHSFLAKGRLLYTHDDTIATLCRRLELIGERDTQLQLLRAATHALAPIYKAHKFFADPRRSRIHVALAPVRGDPIGADSKSSPRATSRTVKSFHRRSRSTRPSSRPCTPTS